MSPQVTKGGIWHRAAMTERVCPIKNAGQSLQDCPALLYYLHHIVEYQLCDLEIQDQAAGVHDGGLCGSYLVCPSKAMLSSLLISARDTCLFVTKELLAG